MLSVTVERTIRCTPEELLAFVLDVHRYTEVDDKIGPIDWVRQDGDVTEFRFRSRLPGLPAGPKVISRMQLTPGERIDIALAPPPRNRLNHKVSTFSASFVCEPVDDGTRLTRTISLGFHPAIRWLVEPILRRRLPPDVEREVEGAKRYLEKP
ncbi:SRPBCC family protein [Amycolatopsis suaedae]|uniref:SRPBCC family protein n=1 Tax=Amycolatopsis suaedae TaxID=2510978 RepID=A0A4Q7J4K7_9PSEU|nr:SRPBCC family protein [Amycolatopsis suaedae]RZQ61602.1 SRPBCC family protein [Amycolatopsis suaedae]